MEKWQETRAARWEDASKVPVEQSALEGWAGGQRDASDCCDTWAGRQSAWPRLSLSI